VEIVSKKYAYIYHLCDEGYHTGFDSVEAAIAIPNGKDRLYDLRTGKPVEGRRENEGYSVSRQG
jgi:hypothetical protein